MIIKQARLPLTADADLWVGRTGSPASPLPAATVKRSDLKSLLGSSLTFLLTQQLRTVQTETNIWDDVLRSRDLRGWSVFSFFSLQTSLHAATVSHTVHVLYPSLLLLLTVS